MDRAHVKTFQVSGLFYFSSTGISFFVFLNVSLFLTESTSWGGEERETERALH